MSKTRMSFVRYLAHHAFTPASEAKFDVITSLPYERHVKLITTYSTSASEKKAFQDQFNELLDAFSHWGLEHKCHTVTVSTGIAKLKKEFFLPEFSGMQSSHYFETIKQYLEKIFLTLQNPDIPLKQRQKEYTTLCTQFAVCGPGIYTHIESIWLNLDPNTSTPERWLADFRTHLIEIYANQYIRKHHISDGNSIHVINGLSAYAHDQKWAPTYSVGKIKDPFATHVNINAEDLVDFHAYFESEYNPTAIRACLQVNVGLALNSIFEQFGHNLNAWNIINKDYMKFIDRITIVFNKLNIPFKTDDFFELKDDCSVFRLNNHHVIDQLCERLFRPTIFFNAAKNAYCELVPLEWIDEKHSGRIMELAAWDMIPKKQFISVLFKLLNVIPDRRISTLIGLLPTDKLHEMVEDKESYTEHLTSITERSKVELIKKYISERTDPPQLLEAKLSSQSLFKTTYSSSFLLLLQVAKGQQDDAEATIKKNPNLLLEKEIVMDYSNRIFSKITPFQYALWALDRHMWEMILKYLPLKVAAKQLQELSEHGVTYVSSPNGKVITEKHFNFTPLITALQEYIDTFDDESVSRWSIIVGSVQKNVPAHVAHEYCRDDRSFNPEPSFKDKSLPRTLEFYNTNKHDFSTWFSDPGLGISFAIARSRLTFRATSDSIRLPRIVCDDLHAIQNLQKVRMQEYEALKIKLLTPESDIALVSLRR